MSTQAPQVLSRKGNVARSRASNELGKSQDAGNAGSRSGRDRPQNEKISEAAKAENLKPPKTKPQTEGEKLVIRRLPPAMSETEFTAILGLEWEVGKGRVDWFQYSPGKISKDPSKASRPSRAYVHVVRRDDIMLLSDNVRAAVWEDAKNSFTDPCLVGPPNVEFSIYKKVPSNKKRADPRQGTIDKDPQFMAFLEKLANGETSDAGDRSGDEAAADHKVTTTPLIEYLKEKKYNRGRDTSSKNAKNSKTDTKGKAVSKDEDSTKRRGRASKEDKNEKPRETVKILTKKAATEQAAEAAKNASSQAVSTSSTANGASNAQEPPKSRRAGITAAAKILQRDLGLSPGSAHRRARQEATKGDSSSRSPAIKDSTAKSSPNTALPVSSPLATTERPATAARAESSKSAATSSTAKSQPGRRNRGGRNADKGKAVETTPIQPTVLPNPPVILKKKPESEASAPKPSVATSEQTAASKAPQIATKAKQPAPKKPAPTVPEATRGFIKHANPSQGVTEALLKKALEVFGPVTYVEIDKRKGFAYVDFANGEGLAKAIAASPIAVAQVNVQVLERKDKKTTTSAGPSSASGAPAAAGTEKADKPSSGRGRRGRGGGGGNKTGEKKEGAAPTANAGGG